MSKIRNLIAGFAGSLALNVLHESLKRKGPEMPRIDLLGENSCVVGLGKFGFAK